MCWLSLTTLPSSFTLYLAPPAAGKTSLLLKIYQSDSRSILFVSPLRALAHEFYKRCRQELGKSVRWPRRASETREFLRQKRYQRRFFLIITCELLSDALLGAVVEKNPLVVLDEFHLYYQWGQDFRPLLWERAMELANSGLSILGFSATMPEEYLRDWKRDFSLGQEYLFLLDEGNLQLRHPPRKITLYPPWAKKVFRRRFFYELLCAPQKQGQTILYFCQYRQEVAWWRDFCAAYGITTLTCVGGEVDQFMEELAGQPSPRIIFSTVALGHGVNLPPLQAIFISYEVVPKHLWAQMVGRGGRRGERFDVYSVERLPWGRKLALDLLKLLLYDIWIRARTILVS
jgi:ATP-dependent DNA helicase RecQ